MNRSRSVPAAIAGAGASIAGIWAAHWAAYFAAHPDQGIRSRVLAATGHGLWLPKAQPVILVALAAMLFASALSGWRSSGGRTRASILGVIARLTGAQVAGYVLIELGERIASHAGIGSILSRELAIGLAVQPLVALAGALIIMLVTRAAAAVAAILKRPDARPRTTAGPRVTFRDAARSFERAVSDPARAPPAFAI